MRVGFYTPNYPGLTGDGGIGSYTRTLGLGLAGRGHTVHVLTPGTGPAVRDGAIHVHFTGTRHLPGVDKLFPGAGACWRVGRAARRLVRDHALDVVEFPNWEGYGLLFLRTARTPTVVRLHTSSRESQAIDGTPPTRWHRWDVRRERWQARWADAVVTHSDAHRRLMVEETGLPAESIRLIPHGVEVHPNFLRPRRPDQPPTVVYLGRLEHRKGTVELLRAVPKVLTAVPDARFVLIGSDRPHCPGGRTHAEYLAAEFPAGVRARITLAGRLPQPEVDRWLQTADVFVAPSRYESFGLIFAEAMRWGTPVVGTTAGGIPEVVEHDRSGVLVPPESPAELAAAVAGLLADPERRGRLGAAGRRRVETEFGTETMVGRVENLYADVIRRNGGRP
jgi:hypothetical protein